MTRKKRAVRSKKNVLVSLQERDESIFILVGLTGYCSVEQICRDHFTSLNRCQRRIRRLFDAGFLHLTVLSSNRSALVRLSRQGLDALTERQPDIAERIRLRGGIHLSGVPHHLAIVDARLYLSLLVKAQQGSFVWSNPGGTLHHVWDLKRWRLEPDGLAELHIDGTQFRLAVEVDLSTERVRALNTKLAKYKEAFLANALDEMWWLIDGGPRRQQTITQLIYNAGLGEHTRIFTREHMVQRPALPPPERMAFG